jgi:hypothetical protein
VNLTFVVSTGRAGSTLLSRMLHEHPDVLSVSEFFAVLQGVLRRNAYPGGELDGAALWKLVSAPDPIADALVRDGLASPEMFYPYATGRYRPQAGIPVICHSTLSLLSEDPDGLLDVLAAELPGWPRRSAADQYRALFAFLAGHLGRPVVVERSGGSLILVRLLRREFPEARFVHMHRDGPDCALSMSKFPMFRLGIVTLRAALAAGLPAGSTLAQIQAALPDAYAGVLSPPYDLTGLAGLDIAPSVFGGIWSDMVTGGMAALGALPTGTWSMLAYEDLLADPAAELRRLAEFIGVAATPGWLAAAGALADPVRAGAAARLDPAELGRLRDACAPGMAAIQAWQAKAAPAAG